MKPTNVKPTNLNILWGLLLIVAGVIALLQSFELIATYNTWGIVWGVLFAIAGFAFLWWFLRDITDAWWAVIPGLTLLALAGVIAAGWLGWAEQNGAWLGGFFLAAIGLSFWIIYFIRPSHWWPIIPGGVLFTLAAVVTASTWIEGTAIAAILFFGLALTFGLVYILPTPEGRMIWALITAGVLVLLGLLTALTYTSAVNYVWAVALILVGVYMLYRQGRGGITRHG